MPGLSFQGQRSRGFGSQASRGSRMPLRWLVPVVLIVLCIALITLCVRLEGAGPFAAVRAGVQSVTTPVSQAVLGLTGSIGQGNEDEGELSALRTENEQLRTLVAELEEYRQQNQRLTALVQIGDTYSLATKSASVVATTSGWDKTATIDKGSADGVQVGMGVISSCGLYGQVESVTASNAVVRLVTDAASSVSVMIQGSRARGILTGSYDGTLTLNYVSVEYTVGEGDYVITSGAGGVYPKGIIVGTVKDVQTDSSKLYYRITVELISSLTSCQEVLVLTGDEAEVKNLIDEDTLTAIKEATLQTSSEELTNKLNAASSGTASVSEDGTAGSDGVSPAGTGTTAGLESGSDGSDGSDGDSSSGGTGDGEEG